MSNRGRCRNITYELLFRSDTEESDTPEPKSSVHYKNCSHKSLHNHEYLKKHTNIKKDTSQANNEQTQPKNSSTSKNYYDL